MWRRGGVPRVNYQNIEAGGGNRKIPLKAGRVRVVVQCRVMDRGYPRL